MNFDWSELAFGSKKPVSGLKATFIAAPRELSTTRFTQLVKEYLPEGNIVLGLAKEDYIVGFEGQPQFRTLKPKSVQDIIVKVNKSSSKNKIYMLHYFQRELDYILEELNFRQVVFVNGSWRYAFHTLSRYFTLTERQIPYRLVSPFADEAEAKKFALETKLPKLPASGIFTEKEMLELAERAATHSYDYGFQTGLSLGRKQGNRYELLALAFNEVIPYQTYAMHFGASREANFSPTNDLNHYDTTHAEIAVIIKAQKERLDLEGATIFINLLPCPTCARALSQTDIAEVVYREDHSSGYAVKMLEESGKKVRRLV